MAVLHSKLVGIVIAMEIVRTRIHFLSDVFLPPSPSSDVQVGEQVVLWEMHVHITCCF